MSSSQYVDMSGFGFEIKSRDRDTCEYIIRKKDGVVYMKLYEIMPGVQLYYFDIHTEEELSGAMDQIAFYQIAYSHSGVYKSRIDRHRTINVHSGELFVCKNIYSGISSSMPLGYYDGVSVLIFPRQLNDMSRAIFRFHGIDIEELFEKLLENKQLCRFSCKDRILLLFEQLFELSKAGDIKKIRHSFIDAVIGLYDSDTDLVSNYCNVNDSTVSKINDIRKYIEDNFQRHIRIEELSALYHTSPTSLKQNFKRMYGHSPYEILKRYRMEVAASRLRLSQDSIAKIAAYVGYENPSKFSAAFFSVYGLTPKNYRKTVRMDCQV